MKRHIVLVGLPGSGKTTVGRLVAAQLGAPFVDLDHAIERRAGRTISQLFAEWGEAHFRTLEREEMSRVLAGEPAVVAPGGGWAAQPGNLDGLAGLAFTVYLATNPELAAARAARAPEGRPLLAGADVERMRELFALRRAFYERSEAVVSADASEPDRVAARVVELARSRAGWY